MSRDDWTSLYPSEVFLDWVVNGDEPRFCPNRNPDGGMKCGALLGHSGRCVERNMGRPDEDPYFDGSAARNNPSQLRRPAHV